MTGAIVDSIATGLRRRRARVRGETTPGIRYVRTNAGQLRLVDTGGDKPVILTTPDGPCVIEHYRQLIDSLSEVFRVICFDMPGFGFSFPSTRYRFRIPEAADATLELLDALSINRAIIAFTCVNGIVALNLAQRYPNRVSHLILAQTPGMAGMRQWTNRNIPRVLRVPFVGQLTGLIGTQYLATNWFKLALPKESEHKRRFVETAKHALQTGGCFCLASQVQGALECSDEDADHVTCPTLMIHGDSDYSHRQTDFQSLAGTIPHARIVSFEGCGHFPNLERSSEYVEHLQRFVRA